jgi:lipid A 3-O-deacylase
MLFFSFAHLLGQGAARAPRIWPALVLFVLLGAAVPAWAQSTGGWADGWDFALKGGSANQSDVDKLGIVAGRTRAEPLWQGQAWSLRLRHEIEVAGWRVPQAKDLMEAGYTPMFRLQRPVSDGGVVAFVEAGIGVRLLSHLHTTPERSLSTAFQFSNELGAGLQFGPQGRVTVGLRYQHISNAGIKRPNPGMDLYLGYVGYRF